MTTDEKIRFDTWKTHDLTRFKDVFKTNKNITTTLYERTSKSTNGKKMDIEFLDALNYLNNNRDYHENEINFWVEDENIDVCQGDDCCEEVDYCDCNKKCICGHHIRKLYYIQNIEDTISCLVGCCCIKKVSEDLYSRLTKEKCKVCNATLMDRRLKYQNNDYCSKDCSNWNLCGKWTITLRGEKTTYFDLITTNPKGAEWCYTKLSLKPPLKYYIEKGLPYLKHH